MTISVGIGIANFPFDDARGFWQWVDVCDNGGIDSIWQSDRLISRDANLECMSVMAALAGATRRIKFGMNVASLGLRDPVLTAKQCATIDVRGILPARSSVHFAQTGAAAATVVGGRLGTAGHRADRTLGHGLAGRHRIGGQGRPGDSCHQGEDARVFSEHR